MCLLTGCPRSATIVAQTDVVVFEINHAALNDLLTMRPEIAAHLANTVASRQEQLTRAGQSRLETLSESQDSTTQRILDRMREFFSALTNRLTLL